MNVIIANKYISMLNSLNIEVIAKEIGEFSVDDIIAKFKNFYFNRMILDITALKNYRDISTLQKLSLSLDMSKVILVLDDSSELSSMEFLSNIISIGIYNFAKNPEGILYLISNPNTYRDVAQYHQIGTSNIQSNNQYFYNNKVDSELVGSSPTRVLGIKNVTRQAGATTLTYLFKKVLSKYYSVVAIEIGKSDFRFFNDKELISVTNNDAATVIAHNSDKEIILVDLNDNKQMEDLCHDIIYLVEPSTIKLNRIMLINGKILQSLRNKKVILNQSLLDSKDVSDFEYESKLNVFYNLPNLDDRAPELKEVNDLLIKLGFTRVEK